MQFNGNVSRRAVNTAFSLHKGNTRYHVQALCMLHYKTGTQHVHVLGGSKTRGQNLTSLYVFNVAKQLFCQYLRNNNI